MKKKFIDSLFRNGLNSGKENMISADRDWAAMERRLDRRERRRRIFFWLNTSTGIALLFVAGFFLWPASEKPQGDENITVENKPPSSTIPDDPQHPHLPASVQSPASSPASKKIDLLAGISRNKIGEAIPTHNRNKKDLPTIHHILEENDRTVPVASVAPDVLTTETVTPRSQEEKSSIPATGELEKNAPDKLPEDTASTSKQNIPATTEKETEGKISEKTQQPVRKHALYYGPVAGPDLSMIKSQGIKKMGYNVGLLIGYRFSDHWSAETGVIWAEKKYFTDGKYFHKYGAGIPSSVKLLSLDGGCAMFVLPLAVRYNFNLGKQSFFTTAGLDSYLMQKESYDYVAEANGSTYNGYRSYKSSGNYLFAGLQFSAGYSYPLSSRLELRAEPYIHLPLKQMGVGRMPITSMGVQVGLMMK